MPVTIDPRLPAELAALLDAHEVPHDCDALLWEIEKHGYWLYLSGPDEGKVNRENRWEARIGDVETDTRRTICRGQTPRLALARAFQWIVSREGR